MLSCEPHKLSILTKVISGHNNLKTITSKEATFLTKNTAISVKNITILFCIPIISFIYIISPFRDLVPGWRSNQLHSTDSNEYVAFKSCPALYIKEGNLPVICIISTCDISKISSISRLRSFPYEHIILQSIMSIRSVPLMPKPWNWTPGLLARSAQD